jgi:transposase-like protein
MVPSEIADNETMKLLQLKCPHCDSTEFTYCRSYETQNNGARSLYECDACRQTFSETSGSFLEGLRKPIGLIVTVLKARSEGLGLNAACRAFGIAKNTLLDWERRFAGVKETLMLYSLMHIFLAQLIEGDELYVKVRKNVPVEDCEGWTIMLMERASRFIWALECGEKNRALFLHAIQLLKNVIDRSGSVTLVTDGERRYAGILFEICHETVCNGKPGRPPKVLRKGVKARLKNKGDRAHKPAGARPKYETPRPEHPETRQDIGDGDIHANHAEATNASIRRRNSAYRRKTNTYAKSKTGLQRTLDIFWIVHNFIRKHFTTGTVPAVALGILEQGLSWEQVLTIRTSSSMRVFAA